jgi:leucyl/phenylalanyl-tRNA---protein transferase
VAAAERMSPSGLPNVGQRVVRRLNAVCQHGAGKLQRLLGRASTLLTGNPMGGECGIADGLPLTVDQMLRGYMRGLFPMDVRGRLRWRCPEPRFALPLAELRMPAGIEQAVCLDEFEFRFDGAPLEVIEACAQVPDADWLSARLKRLYFELFELGVMHTVEAWRGGRLVGGSFGLSLGRVWTHEGRFERVPLAADAQFVHLAQDLSKRGYSCIEGQVHFDIMERLGGRYMRGDEYQSILARGFFAPAASELRAPRIGRTTDS